MTATLASILVASDERWGAKWAWRIVRFVHALPFLALAFGFGIGFLPNDLGRRDIQHSGRGMPISWFKEWRRGY